MRRARMRRRIRRRLRPARRLTWKGTGAAIMAGTVLAAIIHASASGPHPARAGPAGIAPVRGALTPVSWARLLLTDEHWPRSRCDLSAVERWEAAEGGNWANTARYNPLDTTMPEPGSWVINSAGVRAYTSWSQGMDATVATLALPAYTRIRRELAAGTDAQAVADQVATSPWGTSWFTASC